MTRFIICLFIFISAFNSVNADNVTKDKNLKVYGKIIDSQTGELLPGASIYVENTARGAASDIDGEFSLSLHEGDYVLTVTFVGYQKKTINLVVPYNGLISIMLDPLKNELNEVRVSGKRPDENIQSLQMGMQKLDKMTIKRIPAFMGEIDVIKAIQLLPGVQSTSEGSSGFSVRGGAPDENLILLDESPVYNASHLMGFFSVFNNDFVQDVTLYKGDIPASEGGRLSSFLDIKSINGAPGKIKGQGGIGSISSRLMLEGSVAPKTTFAVSGRRTYADLGLKAYDYERFEKTQLYFYDVNLKLTHTFSETDRLFFSGYLGNDVFGESDFGIQFGNTIGSLRWNHIFSPEIRSDLVLFGTKYSYSLGGDDEEEPNNSFEWVSDVVDYGIKYDIIWDLFENVSLQTGVSSTLHQFSPGSFFSKDTAAFFNDFIIKGTQALEHGAYFTVNPTLGNKIKLKLGLRVSAFQSIGSSEVFNFDENYNRLDSSLYDNGEIYNTHWGIEPRLGLTYVINKSTSLKASYNRNFQYMQIASNSTSGSPFEIWFPASPNVKPQEVNQFSVGVFKNIFNNTVELSLEGYYKNYNNTIDFKDHANLFLNKYLEGEIRVGEAEAYGLEFLARINRPRWNGWIAYTLSRSERTIAEINDGKAYLAPFDKTHDLALVFNYNFSDRFSLSANWVYASGQAVTFPTGRFEYGNKTLPIYSGRNDYRMPDYHRFDLGLTYYPKHKPGRRWQGEWNLSVYNAYNRHNAWTINFYKDEVNPNQMNAEKTYLFPVLPAVTYNFKF